MRKINEGKVRHFLKDADPKFLAACKSVNLPPTRRQASKWLSGLGKAWKEGRS
jgi:hypothetical protein